MASSAIAVATRAVARNYASRSRTYTPPFALVGVGSNTIGNAVWFASAVSNGKLSTSADASAASAAPK